MSESLDFHEDYPSIESYVLSLLIISITDFHFPAWTTKPIKQDVVYEDAQGVKDALDKLQKLPPLVTTQEVSSFNQNIPKRGIMKLNG